MMQQAQMSEQVLNRLAKVLFATLQDLGEHNPKLAQQRAVDAWKSCQGSFPALSHQFYETSQQLGQQAKPGDELRSEK